MGRAERVRNRLESYYSSAHRLLSIYPRVMEAIQTTWLQQLDLQRHSVAVGAAMAMLAIFYQESEPNADVDPQIALIGGTMHDVGKLRYADIGNKPRNLTHYEKHKIKKHAEDGFYICINAGMEREAAMAVLTHHENWDGTGYPYGIKGEEINIYGQMARICDHWDTGFGRAARDEKKVILEIMNFAGTLFNPVLVKIFLENYTEIRNGVTEIVEPIKVYEQSQQPIDWVYWRTSQQPVFAK